MRRARRDIIAALVAAGCESYQVEEKSIADLQADMGAGRVTSETLVRAYQDRIARFDNAGPRVNSVLALNPEAATQARALDDERKAGRVRGPLHGVPILVKDNIETADNLATTAGSLALKANVGGVDAPAIAPLRAAGALILGKTNLSEWANIRCSTSISGWSAIGGLTRNPYALDRTAAGSSSGSGAAASASFAAAAIGTETDGSIVSPANASGIVGIKPTVGLISRARIIPISHTQDTPGPMTRSVADAALLLTIMAGVDPSDAATAEADAHRSDYMRALDKDALRGARLGVLRFHAGAHRRTDEVFAQTLEVLKAAGAQITEIETFEPMADLRKAERLLLIAELKTDLNAYLATTPKAVAARTLKQLIAFNDANSAELALFGQDQFESAEATQGCDEPGYAEAAATARRLAGPEGIDKLLTERRLDALIAPTGGPAWKIDFAIGDRGVGGAARLPAAAGYPHITVPMGAIRGLPVGLSFIGPAWGEARLIGLAYAFEQLTHARIAPRFLQTVDAL